MKTEAYELNYRFEENHWWFAARRGILCSLIRDCMKKGYVHSSPMQILDYGCGTGGLTSALEEFGVVTGVDESEEALSYCRERGMQNVQHIRSAKDLPDAAFDLVGCFDVLEHFEDDVGLLTELRRTLKSGGILFLTVPALSCLWSGEDVVSKHVRRYRKSDLYVKVRQAGFKILKASYFNSFLFPLIFTIRVFNRFFRPATLQCSDVSSVREPFNTILKYIFSTERFVLKYGKFPLGVSILLIAKK